MPLEYRVTLPLRWRDIDPLGHLNQSVYHELLEEARAGLIGELLDRGGPAHRPGAYVVRHVDLDYQHEVRREDLTVDALARVARVGESSIVIEHELRLPDGTLAAAGHTVLVGWEADTRGKRTLSAAERATLLAD